MVVNNSNSEGTEIRCTEESKGGLKYDVILADAATEPPEQVKRPISPPKNISEDEIIEKLKAAEERRLSMEAEKRHSLISRFEKFSLEKSEIEAKQLEEKKLQKEKLEKKIEEHNEKREAYLMDVQKKLRRHFDDIEKIMLSMKKKDDASSTEQQREELQKKLQERMEKRDAYLEEVKNKSRHFTDVEKARISAEKLREKEKETLNQMIAQNEEKAKLAAEYRNDNLTKLLERLKEQSVRGESLRQNMHNQRQILKNQIDTKLQEAEQRRQMVLLKEKEKLRNSVSRTEEKIKQARAKKTQNEKEGTDANNVAEACD